MEEHAERVRRLAMEIDRKAEVQQMSSVPRRGHPLSPGPDDIQVELPKLAKRNCALCNGKGIMLHGAQVRAGASVTPVPCHCAEKGYKKFMEGRIKMPCRLCGKVGWCGHRPRTLKQLLFEKTENDFRARAALQPRATRVKTRNRASILKGSRDARETKQESNRQDQSRSSKAFGGPVGEPAQSTVPRRQGALPGLQPGSPSA